MSDSSVTLSSEEYDSYSSEYTSSDSEDSFTGSAHVTYDHRYLSDHPSNSLMGLPLKCDSSNHGTATTTNKLTPLSKALPIIHEYLSCNTTTEENNNNHNRSFGSSLPMGQLIDVISTTTPTTTKTTTTNYDQQHQSSFVLASSLSHEKQVALQKTHNLVPNNGKTTTNTLVHYTTLSDSELNAVKINSEKLIRSKSLSITPKLCNTEDLSQTQLNKIRTNSSNIRSFQNNQSILKSRVYEDIKFSSTISDPIIKNLFMGKPIESTMLSVKGKEEGGSGGEEKEKKKKWKCGTIARMKKHHSYYCDLYEKTKLKDLILDLSFKSDKDFIIIIPSPEFLKSSCLPGNVMTLEIIASHIALFHTKDKVPIMNDMNDSSLYEYQTLLKGRKIELRRLDQSTIEVNGRWIAKLDEKCGDGHIYIMQKFVPVLKVQPKQQPVLKKAEKTTNNNNNNNNKKEIDQGPELIDIEKEPAQNLEIVRVEEELPSIDPNNGEKKKNINTTKVDEETEIVGTSIMSPVHSHILYNSPKMSILVNNMLNTSYDAKLNLGSYLNNVDKKRLITSSVSPTSGNIYLKTYSADDIYKKTQLTAMRTKEYLRPISSYTIGCDHSNIIELDDDIKMKEYKINTSALPIRKSELINHIAVISFPLSCGEKCSSVSFQVSDEITSKDLYISTDQNILLRFNENLLDTISINAANVDTFPSYIIADDEFNSDINDMITLQLSVNKSLSNKIYKTEISFEQFNNAILPFCAPRIIRRLKSGGKALLSDIVTLSNTNRFSVGTDFTKKKTETKRIMIMYGDNRALLLKNRMTLTFLKETFAKGDEKIERYAVDGRNSSKLSFKKLVTKKGKSRLLSVTLPDPLQSNKLKAFIFKLGNTTDVGENGNTHYGASKGGLRMYFELDRDGNLRELFVSYLLRNMNDDDIDSQLTSNNNTSATTATATTTTTTTTTTNQINPMNMAKILHDEAILLHDMNMRISNTYLDVRAKKLCSTLKINEKKRAKEFFTGLKCDILDHVERTRLKMDTTHFIKPSSLQSRELVESNFLQPHQTVQTQLSDCINSHISSSSSSSSGSTKPLKISDTLIKLACDDLTTSDQKIYFHRLTCIIDAIISKI